MKIEYRKACPADYDEVNRLNKEIYRYHKAILPEIFRAPEMTDYSREDFADEIACDDKLWAVATADNKICGVVFAYETADRFDNIYTLVDLIFVESEFRGLGIGARLMRMAENFALKNGTKSLELSVWAKNDAREFYEKSGFSYKSYRMKKEIKRAEE